MLLDSKADPYREVRRKPPPTSGVTAPSSVDVRLHSRSGSPGALLRRGPLGTGLATFTASGSSSPYGVTAAGACWVWCRRRHRVVAGVGVYEMDVVGFVRRARFPLDGDRLFADRLAGGREPLFPFLGSLGFTVSEQQQPTTHETATSLCL